MVSRSQCNNGSAFGVIRKDSCLQGRHAQLVLLLTNGDSHVQSIYAQSVHLARRVDSCFLGARSILINLRDLKQNYVLLFLFLPNSLKKISYIVKSIKTMVYIFPETSVRNYVTNVAALLSLTAMNVSWTPIQTLTIETYPTVVRYVKA